MIADETTKLKAEIQRLRSLLAKSGRERQRLVDAACAKLTDLAEQIEWTGETESLELAETARDEFMVALYPPRLAELRAEEMACG